MTRNFWEDPLRKHHIICDKIRPLISPLVDAFGVSHFSYFFVTREGHSACLSSNPERLEHYLYQSLFLHNPFLKDPQLVPEGVFFNKDSIVLTSKNGGKLEGFSFGAHEKNYSLFVNELPLLKRFCFEFQRKAEKSLQKLEPVDIRPFFGARFFKREENRSRLGKETRAHFLAQLKVQAPVLSKREKECLFLYLKGETARSIADALELSHRTVESYLASTKYKLDCYQKTDLLKKAQELQDYGLLLP